MADFSQVTNNVVRFFEPVAQLPKVVLDGLPSSGTLAESTQNVLRALLNLGTQVGSSVAATNLNPQRITNFARSTIGTFTNVAGNVLAATINPISPPVAQAVRIPVGIVDYLGRNYVR